MARLRAFFKTRTGRLVVHDGGLALAAGYASWDAAGHSLTWGAASAVGYVILKTLFRLVLPVPAESEQQAHEVRTNIHARLALLPPATGRKGGALPSPRDDRDWAAVAPTKVPSSLHNGVGLVWGMLLNDRLGCCYPAALLHALQVLTAGTAYPYTPTDADCLLVYEAMGYDPTKTLPDGTNPTDQGTVGRTLYAWAKKKGLIGSYVSVEVSRTGLRAAIAGYKVALCEWALPTGAQTEGDVWTVPRTGKAAGSWGGHATMEPGFTSADDDNVTWGEEGRVTAAFQTDYMQAAWAVTLAPGANIPAIMAQLHAAA